jgi:hypothetical protein
MIMQAILTALSFKPKHVASPFAWVGHIPFAATLVSETKPNIIVELGTHSGNSYFTFCQAVQENKLSTLCYAIDTWQGEAHAGYYDETVFNNVNKYNQENYRGFSYLLRTTFDEAVKQFADNSIDLLHIDGLHTYEAVKNDYETWLPKVKEGGVILFHDICCRHAEFGVWQLWAEIESKNKNTLILPHSYGLGVLVKNEEVLSNKFLNFITEKESAGFLQHMFLNAAGSLIEHALNVQKNKVWAQVFISEGGRFTENKSIRLAYDPETRVTLTVPIPESFKCENKLHIRLDPAECEGVIIIEEISIITGFSDGKIKNRRELKKDEITPVQHLREIQKCPGHYLSLGNDPQIELVAFFLEDNQFAQLEVILSIKRSSRDIATYAEILLEDIEGEMQKQFMELQACGNNIINLDAENSALLGVIHKMESSLMWRLTEAFRSAPSKSPIKCL